MFIFPSPFIFTFSVKEHQAIKQKYAEKILLDKDKNTQNESYKWSQNATSNMITSYHQDVHFFDNTFLNEVVWPAIDALYKKHSLFVDLIPLHSKIEHVWWNVYEPGDYAEIHTHGKNFISGLYILELNEQNNTVFFEESSLGFCSKAADWAKEGDVLLFPSELKHYTLPAKNKRITVSFNIFTQFKNKIEFN